MTEEIINHRVKMSSRDRICAKILSLKKYPIVRPTKQSECRAVWELTPFQQQCMKSYYLGLLITRTSNYHQLRLCHQGEKTCLHAPCQYPDTVEHMISCEYYRSKLVIDENKSYHECFADFLSNINSERIELFKQPLIYTPKSSSSFADNNA